jgi:hypothetical protein
MEMGMAQQKELCRLEMDNVADYVKRVQWELGNHRYANPIQE